MNELRCSSAPKREWPSWPKVLGWLTEDADARMRDRRASQKRPSPQADRPVLRGSPFLPSTVPVLWAC